MFNRDNSSVSVSTSNLKDIISRAGKKIKKVAVLGTLGIVLSGCGNTVTETEDQKPSITIYTEDGKESNVSSLSDIDKKTSVKGIRVENLLDSSTLSGISEFKGLEGIIIVSPQTDDLSVLKGVDVESLTLMDATLADWTFFDGMDSLTDLTVEYTNLSDVSFLDNKTNLLNLDLGNNFINSFDNINLPNIRTLYLDNNAIKSIDLSNYQNLKDLDIQGNYNLYTENNLKYIEEHGIRSDINLDEVNYINEIRKDLEGLNLIDGDNLNNEIKIYDYIKDKMNYDKNAISDNDLAIKYNQDLLKYFVSGIGVCANYAEGLDACLELSNINAYTLHGYLDGEGHTWNLIEIDGQFYLCDITNSTNNIFTKLGSIIESGSLDKKQNAIGDRAKSAFSDYIQTDRIGIKISNEQGKQANTVTSQSGGIQEAKEETVKTVRNGILGGILLLIGGKFVSSLLEDKIRRKKIKRQQYKKRKKERKQELREKKLLARKQTLDTKKITKISRLEAKKKKKERLKIEKEKLLEQKAAKEKAKKLKAQAEAEAKKKAEEKNAIVDKKEIKNVETIKQKTKEELFSEIVFAKIEEEEQSLLDSGIDIIRFRDLDEESKKSKVIEVSDYMKSRMGKTIDEKAIMDIKRSIELASKYREIKNPPFKNIESSNLRDMSQIEREMLGAQKRQYSYIKSELLLSEYELLVSKDDQDYSENRVSKVI